MAAVERHVGRGDVRARLIRARVGPRGVAVAAHLETIEVEWLRPVAKIIRSEQANNLVAGRCRWVGLRETQELELVDAFAVAFWPALAIQHPLKLRPNRYAAFQQETRDTV